MLLLFSGHGFAIAGQKQNVDAIYAAQQEWRNRKRRERELRDKKKLARQANADQSYRQSSGAPQRTAKRAKIHQQDSALAAGFSDGSTPPAPSAPATFTPGIARSAHQFEYTDVTNIPVPAGTVTSSILGVDGTSATAPTSQASQPQDIFADHEDAQRRWREQKLRELAEKRAKGAPSKRGRRKSNGSATRDTRAVLVSSTAVPTEHITGQVNADGAEPVSSSPLENTTAGLVSMARQQMAQYGVELGQHDPVAEDSGGGETIADLERQVQLQENADTVSGQGRIATTMAAFMGEHVASNGMQRQLENAVEGALQAARALSDDPDALGASTVAASISGADGVGQEEQAGQTGQANGLRAEVGQDGGEPTAPTDAREAITAILASSGMTTRTLSDSGDVNSTGAALPPGGQPFSRHRGHSAQNTLSSAAAS